MTDSNYLMDHVIYQIFKCINKKIGKLTDHPPIVIIYVNKIENRIASQIKSKYYLELLTHEITNLEALKIK